MCDRSAEFGEQLSGGCPDEARQDLRRIDRERDTRGAMSRCVRAEGFLQISKAKLPTLVTLLPVLERADRGSARLDLLIAYLVDVASPDDLRRIEIFRDEGYLPERVADLLGYVPQPYTSRLDATVPGENVILSMYSREQKRWAAIHRRVSGEEDIHWGATEPLARRIAALYAIMAENGVADSRFASAAFDDAPVLKRMARLAGDARMATYEPVTDKKEEAEPWKILF